MIKNMDINKIKEVKPPVEVQEDNSLLNQEENFILFLKIEEEQEKAKKLKVKQTTGVAGGALLGGAMAGPVGVIIGGVVGGFLTEWANKG